MHPKLAQSKVESRLLGASTSMVLHEPDSSPMADLLQFNYLHVDDWPPEELAATWRIK
jgi:hypothetical protein